VFKILNKGISGIRAKLQNYLFKRSGQPMLDCKKVFLAFLIFMGVNCLAAFQKGDWLIVTSKGNGKPVYLDDNLTITDPDLNRRAGQGGGILDGPNKLDPRFWKIHWDDLVDGWFAERNENGTEIWLDLFARYVITNLSVPAVKAGDTLSISVTVRNDGKGNITGSLFRVYIWPVVQGVNLIDKDAPVSGGSSKTFSADFVIPSNTSSGTYYLYICFYREIDGKPGYTSSDYILTDKLTTFTVIASNNPPAKPSNLSPANGATVNTLTPTLSASSFSDPDGDSHSASQWRVRESGSTNYIWDSGEDSVNKTSITVPSGKLSWEKTYYWQVRYKDGRGAWSDWSNETWFYTKQQTTTYTLTVRSSPVGGITITGADPDGSIWQQNTDFSRSYPLNSAVALAAPDYYNRTDCTALLPFDRWEGVDQVINNTKGIVTMTSNRQATVYYGQVSSLAGEVGKLSIEAPDAVNPGEEFTITVKGQYTGTRSQQCKLLWCLDINSEGMVISEDVTLPSGQFQFSHKVRAHNGGSGQTFDNSVYLWIDRNNNGQVNLNEILAMVKKQIKIAEVYPVTIHTDFEGQTKIKINGTEYLVPVGGLVVNWAKGQTYTVEMPDQTVRIGETTMTKGAERAILGKDIWLQLILTAENIYKKLIYNKDIFDIINPNGNKFDVKAKGSGQIKITPDRFAMLSLDISPAGAGSIIMKSAGKEQVITSPLCALFPLGSEVVLSASPGIGYSFVSWNVSNNNPNVVGKNGSEIKIKMDSNISATAIFKTTGAQNNQGDVQLSLQLLDFETGEPVSNIRLDLEERDFWNVNPKTIMVLLGNNETPGKLQILYTDNKGIAMKKIDDKLWVLPMLKKNIYYLLRIYPLKEHHRLDGTICTYLAPAEAGNEKCPRKGTAIGFHLSEEDNKVYLVLDSPESNWGSEYWFLTTGENSKGKFEVVNGTASLTMRLIPIKLSDEPFSWALFKDVVNQYNNKHVDKRVPPHIAYDIIMIESGKYIRQSRTTVNEMCWYKITYKYDGLDDPTRTDSGFGYGQLTGTTALEMVEKSNEFKEKLNQYKALGLEEREAKGKAIMDVLKYYATPKGGIEVMLELLNEKFDYKFKDKFWYEVSQNSGKRLDRSYIASWAEALEDYNSEEYNRKQKCWQKLKERPPDKTVSNYLCPIPIPDELNGTKVEEWDTRLVDSDFDGKLDGYDSYPNDPTKKKVAKRQASFEEIEPNDEPEQANELQWNWDIDGAISKEGDIDWFKFTGEQGQSFIARAVPFDDEETGPSPVEPLITLYDENLNPLVSSNSDWAWDNLCAAIKGYKLPKSGVYYLKVEDAGQRGGENYTYFLELKRQLDDDYGDTLDAAQLITNGQTITGYLGHEGDIDVFRIETQADYALTATLSLLAKEDYDLKLTLLDANGNLISEGDWSLDEEAQHSKWTINNIPLNLEGSYYLCVEPAFPEDCGDSLSYSLQFELHSLPKPVIDTNEIAKELLMGENLQVPINIANQGELPFEFQMLLSSSQSQEIPQALTKRAPIFVPSELISQMNQRRSDTSEFSQLPQSIEEHPVVIIPPLGAKRASIQQREAPTGIWLKLFERTNDILQDRPTSFYRIWYQESSEALYFRASLGGRPFEDSKNLLLVVFIGSSQTAPLVKIALLGLGHSDVLSWDETSQQFQQTGQLCWQTISSSELELGVPWEALSFPGNFSVCFALLDFHTQSLEFDLAPQFGWLEVNREISWAQLEPLGGEVEGNKSIPLNLTLDAKELLPGEYKADLFILSRGSIVNEIPVSLHVKPPQFPFESKEGLHMISLPISPDKKWHEIMGLEEDKMQLAIYDPTAQNYRYYNELSEEEKVPKPGQGVWVKLDNPLQTTISGIPPKGTQPFLINLKQGWQIIGTPWQVKWANIKVRKDTEELPLPQAADKGWVYEVLWAWDSQARDYQMVWGGALGLGVLDTLDTFKGYWLMAMEDCQLVIPPKDEAAKAKSSKRQLAKNGFVFGLTADDGKVKRRVWLGFMTADDNRKGLQVPLPPPSPQPASLQIYALSTNGIPLAADVQGRMADKMEWDIVVKWVYSKEIVLTFDGVGYAPKGIGLWLLDTATGKRTYLRTIGAYRFTPSPDETEHRFKIIAEREISGSPWIVGLKATPVRGEGVVVSFSLAKPAQVKVEIQSLNGQRIAVLGGGEFREAGEQKFVWQGVNEKGEKVPAGVYLIRVLVRDEESRQAQAVTMTTIR
jgi:hypothetical protein